MEDSFNEAGGMGGVFIEDLLPMSGQPTLVPGNLSEKLIRNLLRDGKGWETPEGAFEGTGDCPG